MTDHDYIKRAIELSSKSNEQVGCATVIVYKNKIIGEAFNSQRQDNKAINHAEIKALVEANENTGRRKLSGSVAYCSCQPCTMCLTALSYAEIDKIIFYKTMKEVFPRDKHSSIDPYEFTKKLDFQPKLQQLLI